MSWTIRPVTRASSTEHVEVIAESDDHRATITVAIKPGLPVVGLTITDRSGEMVRREITARQLRDLPLSHAQDAVREYARTSRNMAKALGQQVPQVVPAIDANSDPDVRLACIAARYVQAVDAGSPSPNEDVAKKLGMEASQVRDAVHRARRKELLTRPPRSQGRAGGSLTKKGRDLLAKAS